MYFLVEGLLDQRNLSECESPLIALDIKPKEPRDRSLQLPVAESEIPTGTDWSFAVFVAVLKHLWIDMERRRVAHITEHHKERAFHHGILVYKQQSYSLGVKPGATRRDSN